MKFALLSSLVCYGPRPWWIHLFNIKETKKRLEYVTCQRSWIVFLSFKIIDLSYTSRGCVCRMQQQPGCLVELCLPLIKLEFTSPVALGSIFIGDLNHRIMKSKLEGASVTIQYNSDFQLYSRAGPRVVELMEEMHRQDSSIPWKPLCMSSSTLMCFIAWAFTRFELCHLRSNLWDTNIMEIVNNSWYLSNAYSMLGSLFHIHYVV